ncbi:hypothetical protein V2J09_013913 [Rumex salicifolius]
MLVIAPKSHKLNYVLVTPSIIKNLILIHQFIVDNSCSVEFDPFGFSVKDYRTKREIHCSNNSGDLYPFLESTIPNPTALSATINQPNHIWHRRLGHPIPPAFQHLISSLKIPCNKKYGLHLCEACQLGKHFPFTSFIVTCELPQFVVFLTPSQNSKNSTTLFSCNSITKFRTYYVIMARNLTTLCSTILSFSCPHTFQQNGKAERSLRTINNSVRTLLFQAHHPPKFWVEALHAAFHTINRLPSNPFTTSHHMNFCMVGLPHITISESSVVSATKIIQHLSSQTINPPHVIFDESLFPFLHTNTPNSPTEYDFLDFITENHTSPSLQSFPALQPNSANSPASDLAPSSPPPAPAPSQPLNSAGPTSPTPQQPLSPPTSAPEPPHQLELPSPSHHMMTRSRMGIYKPTTIRPYHTHSFIVCTIQCVITALHREFQMTNLGPLHYFLGVAVQRSSQGLFLTQEKYAHEILEKAGMSNYKPTSTPVDLAGKLSPLRETYFRTQLCIKT